MKDKNLKFVKFISSGGYVPSNDLSNIDLELYISQFEITCTCSLVVGAISVSKTYINKNYSKINAFVDMLKKVDFEKLTSDSKWMMIEDASYCTIEYQYTDNEKVKVDYPNNKGLVKLISDFIDNYLLKDEEFRVILKSVADENDGDCVGLKKIIDNNLSFDENYDYNLEEFSNNTIDTTTINSDKKTQQVDVNTLIKNIDERIKNLEQ